MHVAVSLVCEGLATGETLVGALRVVSAQMDRHIVQLGEALAAGGALKKLVDAPGFLVYYKVLCIAIVFLNFLLTKLFRFKLTMIFGHRWSLSESRLGAF